MLREATRWFILSTVAPCNALELLEIQEMGVVLINYLSGRSS